MPSPFHHSLRSLEADRFYRSGIILLTAGGLLTIWGAWFVFARITVYETSDDARLEVVQAVHPVDTRVAGRIVHSTLMLGRDVREGDVLAELDADQERLQLQEEQSRLSGLTPQVGAARAELAAEERALTADRLAGERALEEARAELGAAQAPARFAAEEAARLARLHTRGLVSDADEQRASMDAQTLQARADSLRLAVGRLEATNALEQRDRAVRIERLRAEETRLQGAVATSATAIKRLENEIDRRRIRAPVSGRLAEVADLRVGAVVAEGQRLGAIVAGDLLRVVAQFQPAAAIGRVVPGQTARMRLSGFPWTEYGALSARVESVASEIRSGTIRVELTLVAVRQSAVPLQHGLPGRVEVDVERVSPAALVLRAAGRLVTRPARADAIAAAGNNGR